MVIDAEISMPESWSAMMVGLVPRVYTAQRAWL